MQRGSGAAADAEDSNTGDGKYYIIVRNHFADFITYSSIDDTKTLSTFHTLEQFVM